MEGGVELQDLMSVFILQYRLGTLMWMKGVQEIVLVRCPSGIMTATCGSSVIAVYYYYDVIQYQHFRCFVPQARHAVRSVLDTDILRTSCHV